jgi:uncharacterized membrane protein
MSENNVVKERRHAPWLPDEAKFVTQRTVTVFILLIFAGVCGWVFYQDANESERATVLQTVINLAILVVSYWMGSSKGAADNRDQLNKLIGPQPVVPGTTTITPPASITVSTEPEVPKP